MKTDMKRTSLLVLILLLGLMAKAQTYNSSNSLARVALVYYYQDANGFYQKRENVNLQEVLQIVSSYAYDKKSHELYVQTDRANCIVTVNDDLHKILKKSKSIPQLKGDELSAKVADVNTQLAAHFKYQNELRQKHINDSIQKAREDSIRKAREDSIQKAREDSMRIAEEKKAEEYRKTHNLHMIPTKSVSLKCVLCDQSLATEDTTFCYTILRDTIYVPGIEKGRYGIEYRHIHAAAVPAKMRFDKDYQYHMKIFKDTLENAIKDLSVEGADLLNYSYYLDYQKELKKEAPNGLFLDWEWDNEYSFISFSFTYLNTNKNTIKYIEVFWRVTNDVGDVRKTGSFKGTGPLEEWHSANWNWDNSLYYVAGDATKMEITKVIVTYMNGSKVTIPKNKVCFDFDY